MHQRRCRKPGKVQKRANSTPPPFPCRYGTDFLSFSSPPPHFLCRRPRRHLDSLPPSRGRLSGSAPASSLFGFRGAYHGIPLLALAFLPAPQRPSSFWLLLRLSAFPLCRLFPPRKRRSRTQKATQKLPETSSSGGEEEQPQSVLLSCSVDLQFFELGGTGELVATGRALNPGPRSPEPPGTSVFRPNEVLLPASLSFPPL